MNRRSALTALVTLPILYACSSLNPASLAVEALKPSGGINTDLQAGDRAVNVGDNDNSSVSIEDTGGPVNMNRTEINNQNIPPWMYCLGILGWMLPSPQEIYREIKSWFTK